MKKTLQSIFFAFSIFSFVNAANAQVCPYPSDVCTACPNIYLPATAVTCSGGPLVLSPVVMLPSGMTVKNWSWMPAATATPSSGVGTLPGATTVSPTGPTSYVLSVTGLGINLVADGNFSAWTSPTLCFGTGYTYYSGSSMPSDNYSVGTDPSLFNSSFISMSDHTGDASGQMLIANSGPSSPSTPVWFESEIPVCPGSDYEFSMWHANLENVLAMSDAPQYKVVITGVPGGVLYSGTFPGVLGGGAWKQINFTWSAGPASYVTAEIYEINPNYTPVDFAIDDISINRLCTSTASIDVSIADIVGTTTVCENGFTSTLTCAPLGGTWSSSDPTVATIDALTGELAGISAGTAYVTYSSPLGCDVVKLVTVTPGLPPISGPDDICQFTTHLYTNAASGGTWSATPSTVVFAAPSVGSGYGSYAGTSTVSYVLGGCYVTKKVTVHASPGWGTYYMCVGASVSLPMIPAGGTWTTSTPSIVSLSGSSLTTLSTGTGYVTYTTPAGCSAVSGVSVIDCGVGGPGTVLPFTICEGYTYDANPSLPIGTPTGGTWTVAPGGSVSITTAGIVTAISAGTATISYTVGGVTFSGTVTVIGMPVLGVSAVYGSSPGVSVTGIPAGATIYYSVADPYSSSIWYGSYTAGSGFIPVATIAALVAPYHGPFNFCVNALWTGTCYWQYHECTYVNSWPKPGMPSVAIAEQPDVLLSVIPNPNTGSFTLTGTITENMQLTTAQVVICDVSGKIVHTSTAAMTNGKVDQRIDLGNNAATGIYFIRVKADGVNKVMRVEVIR